MKIASPMNYRIAGKLFRFIFRAKRSPSLRRSAKSVISEDTDDAALMNKAFVFHLKQREPMV